MKKIFIIIVVLLTACSTTNQKNWFLVEDQSTIVIQVNQPFNPYDYIDKTISYYDLIITNPVNPNKVGHYQVVYQYFQATRLLEIEVVNPHKEVITLERCIDGDTAVFNEIGAVRFLYINTPESTTKKEPYGKDASQYTCSLLQQAKEITFEYDGPIHDKYNRTLAWIFIDGQLIQTLIARQGYVQSFYDYGDYRYEQEVLAAHQKAKDEHLNVHLNQ